MDAAGFERALTPNIMGVVNMESCMRYGERSSSPLMSMAAILLALDQ